MTRFSETFHDFAEESVRDTVYKDVQLRMTDPYGYWRVDGIDGYFTNYDLAIKAIDQMLDAKAKAPKVVEPVVEEPKVTKKISKKVS